MIVHSAQNMVQYAKEIGDNLWEVKASLSHGEWLPWVMSNCTFSVDRAGKYMQLAKANSARALNFEGVSSIREALKVIVEDNKPKLPANTETRMIRKEDEFGFPQYEVEVLPSSKLYPWV